jgi:hypothetical protein
VVHIVVGIRKLGDVGWAVAVETAAVFVFEAEGCFDLVVG